MNNDLISRKALKKELQSAKYLCYDNNSISRIKNCEIDRCISFVEDAPTVEERPTGEWIPVSKRLPEEKDYHDCYGLPDGCVIWQLNNGVIGFGWYYNSTQMWSDINDHIIEENGRKIIAWQPLPKPYCGAKMKRGDEE